MIAHIGVALDRSTARTGLLWFASIAGLTTIHITTDSTAKSRSRSSIEVDEIAALGTRPLLVNDSFLETRIRL
jgi:hypothetical protein